MCWNENSIPHTHTDTQRDTHRDTQLACGVWEIYEEAFHCYESVSHEDTVFLFDHKENKVENDVSKNETFKIATKKLKNKQATLD